MSIPGKPTLSKEQATQKIKHYCAWQERCHQEVKEKLYELGLHKKEVDEVLSQLIEENYLNEERFSIQFAGGKFRMKSWGKIKIRYALKQKQVGEYLIKKALQQIDDDTYMAVLQKLAQEKWKTLKGEKSISIKKQKTLNYLLQKGYEAELAKDIISEYT
ncbi:MAG: regulatory protein RecX [Chitinophagaceae bacterium]